VNGFDGDPHSILVALDESTPSADALDVAISIASRSGARLTLIHVIEPPHAPTFVGADVGPFLVAQESDEYAETLLDLAAQRVPEGMPVHTVIRHGRAADEILRRAELAEHDLIVIGSRGLGPIRSILQSVSSAVVHRSRVPVVVVHAGVASPSPAPA
jgi:nucleotide-binding universal stress UspA family protein